MPSAIKLGMKSAALGLALASFCFAEATESIRMTVSDTDQMTVEVHIDGQPGNAVVDTAATYPMFDGRLMTDGNSSAINGTVMILGIAGEREFPTAEIGPVRLGTIPLGTLSAAINDKSAYIGHRTVIPASAFTQRVIDFDFNSNQIAFYDQRPKRQKGWITTKLRYEEIAGLPFIDVRLNGKRGRALIDTGSDATYVNAAFAKHANARPEPEKTRTLFGVDQKGLRVEVFSARQFSIGEHSKSNFNILSANPPLFAHLGLEDEPVMVIGLDMLRNFRLQIDREKRRVHLSRKESASDGRRMRFTPRSGRVPRN